MQARTPNNIEILAAKSDIDNQAEYLTSHNGLLNVNAVIDDQPPISGNNASWKVYRNAAGEVVKLDKIIGATTYVKLIIPLSGDVTIVGFDTIGVWS